MLITFLIQYKHVFFISVNISTRPLKRVRSNWSPTTTLIQFRSRFLSHFHFRMDSIKRPDGQASFVASSENLFSPQYAWSTLVFGLALAGGTISSLA